MNDVIENWDEVYEGGIEADNYVGDLLDSLDCTVNPDIGTEGIYISS